eukprot:gene5220-3737_t
MTAVLHKLQHPPTSHEGRTISVRPLFDTPPRIARRSRLFCMTMTIDICIPEPWIDFNLRCCHSYAHLLLSIRPNHFLSQICKLSALLQSISGTTKAPSLMLNRSIRMPPFPYRVLYHSHVRLCFPPSFPPLLLLTPLKEDVFVFLFSLEVVPHHLLRMPPFPYRVLYHSHVYYVQGHEMMLFRTADSRVVMADAQELRDLLRVLREQRVADLTAEEERIRQLTSELAALQQERRDIASERGKALQRDDAVATDATLAASALKLLAGNFAKGLIEIDDGRCSSSPPDSKHSTFFAATAFLRIPQSLWPKFKVGGWFLRGEDPSPDPILLLRRKVEKHKEQQQKQQQERKQHQLFARTPKYTRLDPIRNSIRRLKQGPRLHGSEDVRLHTPTRLIGVLVPHHPWNVGRPDDDVALEVEVNARRILFELQELYCKSKLYDMLVFLLGHPATGEQSEGYFEDVDGLLELYRDKSKEHSQLAADSPESCPDRAAFLMESLHAAINDGVDEENEIPMSKIQLLYDALEANDTCEDHLDAAIEIGALCFAAEEDARSREEAKRREEQTQRITAAESAATAAAERRSAMKVSPEELFRIAQNVRSGLADESELLQVQAEDDTADAVELNHEEPQFLRRMGLPTNRKPINYRRPLPSQMLREARTPQQRQNILDRLAQQQPQVQRNMNSMERAALAQAKINADRRIIARRTKAQLAAADEAAAADTDTQAADGDAAQSLLETELCEKKEEPNVFGPKSLAPRRLPPWMKHSLHGKPRFGLPESSHSLQEQRKELPIYQKRAELLAHVAAHSVTILVGETGSGKTTQIPQYLAEEGYTKHGIIACTQPRRVAAETLAMRVAEEYGCRLGEEVGYTVRFRDMTTPSLTKIKYMTDGMLLREALLDDSFRRYSVIILDEAHERSINTDLLFHIARTALVKNPSLKVLITSATLETEKFCRYFGVTEGPFMIEGRTFPVETYYLRQPTTDYVRTALQTVMKLHLEEPPGDVLVFLTGQEEIELGGEQLYAWMKALQRTMEVPIPDLMVLPLTATMPQDVQSKVFEATPPGCRKVVLATNVAETSITIGNLYYVIDSGFCKQSIFDPRTGMEELKVVPISQAQAKQRSGRAGRIGPGKCYRMYTEDQFHNDLLAETVPDIMRANLFSVTLQLKAMGIDLATVELLDMPDREAVAAALEKLHYLAALNDDGLLTPLGGRMAELSIDPSQSKTLLTAVDMGCCGPVLTIVSMLAVQRRGVFYRPRDHQDAADAAKRSFEQPEGDQITLMAVYDAWVQNDMSEDWCRRNFLKHRMLVEARDTREQLQGLLSRHHRTISTENDMNLTAVRKALCAGYFFNVAKRIDSHARVYETLADRREVFIHPSSSLMEDPPKYVLYDDLRVTRKVYMMEVLAVEPDWLVELAPAYYSRPKPNTRTKALEALRFIPQLKAGAREESKGPGKLPPPPPLLGWVSP